MNYIRLFWELEQKAKITYKKEKRVKEIQEELKIQENVRSREEEIDNLNSQINTYLKRRKELENEIFEEENRLKVITSEIDANKFKTAKEVKLAEKNRKDIQERLDNLEKNLKSVDNEIEERKRAVNKLKKENEEANLKISKITDEYKKLEAEIAQEKEKFEKEFNEKTKDVPYPILHRYLEVKEDFPFGAITAVEKDFCGNCGAKIPSKIFEELVESSGEEVIQCEICGKILYIVE